MRFGADAADERTICYCRTARDRVCLRGTTVEQIETPKTPRLWIRGQISLTMSCFFKQTPATIGPEFRYSKALMMHSRGE